MNFLDQNLQNAFSRARMSRGECEFIQGVKIIRLELMLLRERDRVRELESREWAVLEEVE